MYERIALSSRLSAIDPCLIKRPDFCCQGKFSNSRRRLRPWSRRNLRRNQRKGRRQKPIPKVRRPTPRPSFRKRQTRRIGSSRRGQSQDRSLPDQDDSNEDQHHHGDQNGNQNSGGDEGNDIDIGSSDHPLSLTTQEPSDHDVDHDHGHQNGDHHSDYHGDQHGDHHGDQNGGDDEDSAVDIGSGDHHPSPTTQVPSDHDADHHHGDHANEEEPEYEERRRRDYGPHGYRHGYGQYHSRRVFPSQYRSFGRINFG